MALKIKFILNFKSTALLGIKYIGKQYYKKANEMSLYSWRFKSITK